MQHAVENAENIRVIVFKVDTLFDFLEISKQTKNIDISILSIDAVVRNKLKGSNLSFHIEHFADESKLSLLIDGKHMITISIPHNRIAETIASLHETIRQATEIIKQLPPSVIVSENNRDDWERI